MKEKGRITSVTIGNLTYHIDENIQEIKEGKTTVTVHFDKEQIEKYIEKQKAKLFKNQKIEFIKLSK
jgi:hypothetical protein